MSSEVSFDTATVGLGWTSTHVMKASHQQHFMTEYSLRRPIHYFNLIMNLRYTYHS